jgi:hypothetical protein
MDREKVDRLSGLSALQIALLAIAGSTVAAVATLIGLRRTGMVRSRSDANQASVQLQPAVRVMTAAAVPNHFSEDIVLPGITFTGADVRVRDERDGRSPEGV